MSRQITRKVAKPVVFWYPPWACWVCRQPITHYPAKFRLAADGDTPLEAIKAFFKNDLHRGPSA